MNTLRASLPTSLPSDPIPLLEALLGLAIQLLIADNPDLLLPPEVPRLHPPQRLAHARLIVGLLRETHYALERYRDVAPRTQTLPARERDGLGDDIPF
jgi:hypothetical protein